MILWYSIYLFSIYIAIFNNPNQKLWIAMFSLVIVADIYGIVFFSYTFPVFSIVLMIIFLRLTLLLNMNFNIKKIFLYTNGFNSITYSLISALIVMLYGIICMLIDYSINPLLYIKPLIYIIQWGIFTLYIYLNIVNKSLNEIYSFFKFLLFFISLFILAVCILQIYGPVWHMPAQSSTYQIYEFQTWGIGSRPTGLTREPSHLVMLMLGCMVGISCFNSFHKYMMIMIWITIGLVSDTRSLLIILLIYILLEIIFEKKSKKTNQIIIFIGLVIFLYEFSSRFISIFSITSDESTLVRYSVLFASIIQYIYNPFDFHPLGESIKEFCINSYGFTSLENALCGKHESLILNWTINYFSILPIFTIPILTFIWIIKSEKNDKLVIMCSLMGGLVFYYWSYPGSGLLLVLVPTILKLIDEKKIIYTN